MVSSDLQTLEPRRSWDELIAYSRDRGQALRRRRAGLTASSLVFALLLVFAGVVVSTGGSSTERLRTSQPAAPPDGGIATGEGGVDGIALPSSAAASVAPPPRVEGGRQDAPKAAPPQSHSASIAASARASARLLPTDRVGFTSADRGQFAQIEVMNGDGSGRAVVTHDIPFNDFSPTWSPDGSRLAFASDRDNNERELKVVNEIYVMNADGSGERRLTHAVPGGNGNNDPEWSPDGSRIAFSGDDAQGDSDVWTVRPDGSDLTNLTHNPGVEDDEPSWSPNGDQIVFVRYSGGASQLWVMSADGSGQRQLTNASTSSQRPAWSPDGHHIAFDRTEADGLRHVWVMDADGSNAHVVVSEAGESSWPTWTPDGNQIVFGYDPSGSMEPSGTVTSPAVPSGTGALYVVSIDGSGLQRLTNPGNGASDYAPSVHRQ